MKEVRRCILVGCTTVCLVAAVPAGAGKLKCPPDSVQVGNVCIDTYEASVWQIDPVANKKFVDKVQAGKATLADLTKGGATQLSPSSCTSSPGYPANFPNTGNWTPVLGSNPPSPGVYAVSIPGVHPSACITWFQANQACLLSGKRLLTNREWQGAAAGTPDPGTDNGTTDCNVGGSGMDTGPVNTGSRSNCKSAWGAFDMVGNVFEWVADWADQANGCLSWPAGFGSDLSCFGGPGAGPGGPGAGFSSFPSALARGGQWSSGSGAGVFDVSARNNPSVEGGDFGFRCAR